jgi:hypothetical protein
MNINVNTVLRKDPVPPLVKVREVAKILSISPHTVHNLIDAGELEARSITAARVKRKIKPRHHVRVTRESLLKFYKDRFGHSLDRALVNPFAA